MTLCIHVSLGIARCKWTSRGKGEDVLFIYYYYFFEIQHTEDMQCSAVQCAHRYCVYLQGAEGAKGEPGGVS